MDPQKFVPLFSVTAEMSDRLQSIGAAMTAFTESSERLHEIGEQMLRWGQKIRVETAVLPEIAAAAFNRPWSDPLPWGDTLIRILPLYGLAAERSQQLAPRLGRRGAAAFQTHTSLTELLSLIGAASQQMGGVGPGTMMFAPLVREPMTKWAGGKSSVDFNYRLAERLAGIRTEDAGISYAEKLNVPKQIGAIDPPAMAFSLDHASLVADKVERSAGRVGIIPGTGYPKATGKAIDAAS
jgi:hypothetical protein